MPRKPRAIPTLPRDAIEDPLDRCILDYCHNLLAGTFLRRLETKHLHPLKSSDLVGRVLAQKGGARPLDDLDLEEARERLRRYLRRASPRAPRRPRPPVASNLRLFRSLFELEADDGSILTFLLALHGSEDLRDLCDLVATGPLVVTARAVAAATLIPTEGVLRALAPSSRLVSSGIVKIEDDGHFLRFKLQLKRGVADLATAPGIDREQLLRRFLAAAEPSTLAWSDFREVEAAARLGRELLGAALARRERGVNVLLRGPTGTGKTELARLIAGDLGVPLFVASSADEEGDSACPQERLSSLLLGHKLLGGSPALMLFDELEDLFEDDLRELVLGRSRAHRMSKQWFNLLLETNPVPTIWITNSTRGIDPAFLRRFSFSLEVRPPGARQRARILARHLGEPGALPAPELEAIAERFAVSAAQLGSAVASARLLAPEGRPNREGIERFLEPAEELLGAGRSRLAPFDPTRFRLDAIASSEDLVALTERLATFRPGPGPGLSLCLYGPPGTGKSEYARHLAHRMGRPVVFRRVSDLQSMWVGQTEQNIAEAFREARDEDALLLLDEADSFLRDRRGAVRSWEVTQVNELLQQLEAFRGVVVCTTNLWRDLDEASLRRFVLKIELRHLDPRRARVVFDALLAPLLPAPVTPVDEDALQGFFGRLHALAPGDLATVRRRLVGLAERPGLTQMLDLIEAEVRVKREGPRPAGFDQGPRPAGIDRRGERP